KGVTCYNSELSELCKGFLSSIDYVGIGGVEFKKYNGKYYFIEMSVRLEGFFKISEISSTPLALISYYDLALKNIPSALSSAKQKDGCGYVDAVGLFVCRIRNRELFQLLRDIAYVVFNSRVGLNVFSFKD